jgi:glutamyl-tRNA reductase
MSLLVVGLSHRTAPVSLLERASVDAAGLPAVLDELLRGDHVTEVMVLSTCNRVEVYAEVDRFHGGLQDTSTVLARRCGLDVPSLGEHLYVHYEDAAVLHLFSVAAGLDSMVVGEAQILGQLRSAYTAAAQLDTVSRTLHELCQQALRVGKRVQAETGIDRAGASVVSVALEEAARVLDRCSRPSGGETDALSRHRPPAGQPAGGVLVASDTTPVSATPRPGRTTSGRHPHPPMTESRAPGPLAGRRALVIGAGSMGALSATTLLRAGIAELTVANRTPERPERLAAQLGAGAGTDLPSVRTATLADLTEELVRADVVIGCTGSVGTVLPAALVEAALPARAGRPLVLLDLALPRDVEGSVSELPGVHYFDLAALQEPAARAGAHEGVERARQLIAEEVAGQLGARRATEITPTVAALRARAAEVVEAELARLDARLPSLDEAARAEVARTVHRVVQTLLHAPTVRVKQLAERPGGDAYADALRELFDLDPAATAAVVSVSLPTEGGSA